MRRKLRLVLSAVALLTCTVFINPSAEARTSPISFTVSQAESLVTLLYRGILFREPDAEGLDHWTNYVLQTGYQGYLRVAVHFGTGNEFNQTTLLSHSPNEIVTNMYRVFFNRPVDETGMATWPGEIASGDTADAVYGIVSSDEFFDDHIRPILPSEND